MDFRIKTKHLCQARIDDSMPYMSHAGWLESYRFNRYSLAIYCHSNIAGCKSLLFIFEKYIQIHIPDSNVVMIDYQKMGSE